MYVTAPIRGHTISLVWSCKAQRENVKGKRNAIMIHFGLVQVASHNNIILMANVLTVSHLEEVDLDSSVAKVQHNGALCAKPVTKVG